VAAEDREREEESERSRTLTNIYLLVFFVLLIGIGVWLVDAMIAARKADECLSSGRRNCMPEVPVRQH
jgi:hypothetical protein